MYYIIKYIKSNIIAWLILTILVSLLVPSGAVAAHHPHKGQGHHAIGAVIVTRQHTKGPEPLEVSVEVAVKYWGGTPPCGGSARVGWVQFENSYHVGEAPFGPEVLGWANFNTPAGENLYSQPPASFTECEVGVNSEYWLTRKELVSDFVHVCQLMVHEFGHLVGHNDQTTDPKSVTYLYPEEAPTVAPCKHARA